MGDHFGAESVFKKPAIPSRYQRSYSSNRPGSTVSNTSAYSSNTVREKIEVLEKVFPQSDDIWENLVRNIDHLLFVRVSESVLQQSPSNNANACPSISPQHTSSNLRFNCTQSTNNAPDVVSQSNQQNIVPAPLLPRSLYRNSRSRIAHTASVPERSEGTNSRNVVSESQYTSQRLAVQNETSQGARNSRSRNQSSQQNTNELTQESNSTLRSDESSALNASEEVVVPPARKESASNGRAETGSKVNKKRPLSEESATDGRRKRPKKDDTVEESTQRASSSSVNKKVVKPTNSRPKKNDLDLIGEFDDENGDSDDSLTAFFQRQRKLTLKKPLSVVRSDSSMLSQNNTVIETKETRKPLTARKTKKTSNAQPKESTKPTVVRRQVKASRDQDSNSEDVSARSQESSNAKTSSRTRTTRVKTTTRAEKVITEVRTKQNSPALEEESESDDRLEVPVRRGGETRKDTRRTVRATVRKMQYKEDTISSDATQSEESTVHEPKNTKKVSNAVKTTRVKSVPSKKPTATVGRTKTAAVNQVKRDAVAKKKKTEAPSQTENEIASNSANRMERSMDASFFGDVSSIIGNASVSMVCLEKEKKTKKSQSSHETNTPMHFFSPFASANLRSTSGFSAISTPLSKSMAKNVLGKRVKKPNVGAELRHELKENNKKRKNKKNPPVTQPVHEATATSISDCEVSDFSDTD